MIYDCFTFFNELDILEIRLKILEGVVDKFVLVEARETHSGSPKPLLFENNKDRFAIYLDKIIHLIVDKFPLGCDSWGRENIQRNYISEGLKGCNDDDVIIISDVDEIPNPDVIRHFKPGGGIWNLTQKMYYCFLNYRDITDPIWCLGTRLLTYRDFCNCLDGKDVSFPVCLVSEYNQGTTATKIRLCAPCKKVKNGGWHFSYLGGVDAIIRKIQSFAHQEYNRMEISNKESIERAIKTGRDILGRDKFYIAERVTLKTLPEYVVKNRSSYPDLFIEESDIWSALKMRLRVMYFVRKRQVIYYVKKLFRVG